jgi:hypothetical protein
LTGFRCIIKLADVEIGAAECKKKQLAKRLASAEALKNLNLTDEDKPPPSPTTAPLEPRTPLSKKTQTGPWQAEYDSRELMQTESVTQHCNLLLEVMLLNAKPDHDKLFTAHRLIQELDDAKALLTEIKVDRTFIVGSFAVNCVRDDRFEVDVVGVCLQG